MQAEELWNHFIEEYPRYKHHTYEAWQYGVVPDELAELTRQGVKTATTSGYDLYEADQEPLPLEGGFNVILDRQDNAICITQITKVYVVPFQDVSERHAFKEGEGDRTLGYWRSVHTDFFSEAYQEAGLPFSEESQVVCEEFEMMFPGAEQ